MVNPFVHQYAEKAVDDEITKLYGRLSARRTAESNRHKHSSPAV